MHIPILLQGEVLQKKNLFVDDNFVFPVFLCPVRNITTKRPYTNPVTGEVLMVNDFQDTGLLQGLCVIQPTPEEAETGQLVTLDPADESCFSFFRVPAFSTCKNDCPGGKYLDIVQL